jgi:hypothetical protein
VLPEWEEWDWEKDAEAQEIIAMPSLQTLIISECKLHRLPAGLASSRRVALRDLFLCDPANLTALENFPSVVQLGVVRCPSLKIMRGFRRMQVVLIESCPALELVQAGPALDIVELKDPEMETLPEYLKNVNPRYLELSYNKKVHESSLSPGSSEWTKISHIVSAKSTASKIEI